MAIGHSTLTGHFLATPFQLLLNATFWSANHMADAQRIQASRPTITCFHDSLKREKMSKTTMGISNGQNTCAWLNKWINLKVRMKGSQSLCFWSLGGAMATTKPSHEICAVWPNPGMEEVLSTKLPSHESSQTQGTNPESVFLWIQRKQNKKKHISGLDGQEKNIWNILLSLELFITCSLSKQSSDAFICLKRFSIFLLLMYADTTPWVWDDVFNVPVIVVVLIWEDFVKALILNKKTQSFHFFHSKLLV